ncbi:transducin beta-like protein 3 [Lutzomyia longipalpis]|uniref:transducin beta-like protein 3 n=1 Tax=Lutzomyia longipalpis TaxID=7200 RepID=UPI002483AFA2|nr:transducin beta-like protein 3 [Lutzomyia longipalpis]
MSKNQLKESFEVENAFEAFHTTGFVAWTGDELVCQDNERINIVNVENGKVDRSIRGGATEVETDDATYTFAVNLDGNLILSAHKSGLLKLWDGQSCSLVRMWRGVHQGPISRVAFSPSKDTEIVASGGCDASVRIWDYTKKICLANLRGCQGVIGLLTFATAEPLIYAVGDDNRIFGWNYKSREVICTLEAHYSRVTSLSLTPEEDFLVSTSRDKVLILWNLKEKKSVKVIPAYEALESSFILPNGISLPGGITLPPEGIYVAVGGESGQIKVWEVTKAKIIFTQTNSLVSKAEEEGGLAITQLLWCPKSQRIGIVTADHNILIHNIGTFHCAKQLIGFSDEILDMAFVGKKDRYLAVATNSPDIKFYDTTTMNCQVLKGHTDIVMSLAARGKLLVSASKDSTVRLWSLKPDSFDVTCIGVGRKHTASISSVAMSRLSTSFFASVSQDLCLKVWTIPKDPKVDEEASLACTATQIVHEKDVNSVTVSPNDKLLATGSQDKTAKIWNTSNLSLVGVLKGHKRPVWCVRFSPVDQVLLTSSADGTIRIWAITSFTCLKTFEGHEGSVLRAEFISRGMQILSADADGFIKLWSIKTNECVTTLDHHEGRVWTMALPTNERHFFSGGSDSKLLQWRDVTEEKRTEERKKVQEVVLQEQELNNLLHQGKFQKALQIAIRLEKPQMTLKIVKKIVEGQVEGLEETIDGLNDMDKETLLNHAAKWNTNSKNSRPAQLVVNILLKNMLAGSFQPSGAARIVETLLPYTDRHLRRVTEFMKDLNFVEYTLKSMQPHADTS